MAPQKLNRSQFVTGSEKHRNPRFRPYAFTEQGVAMLATVNIEIMRAFVFDAIRQLMVTPARGRKEIGFRSRAVKK